jgi:hypothetical protein
MVLAQLALPVLRKTTHILLPRTPVPSIDHAKKALFYTRNSQNTRKNGKSDWSMMNA